MAAGRLRLAVLVALRSLVIDVETFVGNIKTLARFIAAADVAKK